eukprot:CAMPEP_0184862302 /NCGR_PEP_ID=MMETSP0580-20130426/6774_1 /TAXON_ID=1118495 /ORGANISM="Dactyliosolen fragilissimus" /LENGTH=357 /DNA_ID=CAMNT_0027360089 /DNA_START=544 /DNA_END=1617 /DNA_ORIENTATION=-
MTSTPALLLQKDTSGEGVLDNSGGSASSVLVHPIVLLSILDHHARRQEGSGRVIGTLLGRRDGDKVEITNCFAVPHAEEGTYESGFDVSIGKVFNQQMLALHLRTNRTETVMGWYATALPEDHGTGHLIAGSSVPLQEFYEAECEQFDPIHLVLDTSLMQNSIGLRAFTAHPISIRGEPLGNIFHEVRLALKSNESEKIAIDAMIKSHSPLTSSPHTQDPSIGNIKKHNTPEEHKNDSQDDQYNNKIANNKNTTIAQTDANATASLHESMTKLQDMLEIASSYVDSVVDGSTPADDAIGRKIADALSGVPRIRPESFEKMFNESLQDLLMVTYLSNLTRTQLGLAEKINESLDKNLK